MDKPTLISLVTLSFGTMSISVESSPRNSVQEFPLGQPDFGCFLRGLKRSESSPVSKIETVQNVGVRPLSEREADPTLRDGIVAVERTVHDGGPDFSIR
jgi:hypothetical protein